MGFWWRIGRGERAARREVELGGQGGYRWTYTPNPNLGWIGICMRYLVQGRRLERVV